jgi:hypothetical protein
MLSTRFSVYLILALLIFVWWHPARADTTENIAAVQCDAAHNKVLITFATVLDEHPAIGQTLTADADNLTTAPIPAALQSSWRNIPYDNGADCKLADGQVVSVSVLDGPVVDDEGGADPNSTFNLLINRNLIYDGLEYYRGHGAGYDLSAIEYDGKSLTECNPHEPDDEGSFSSKPICYDVSDRLLPGHKYYTPAEQTTWDQSQLRTSLAKNESPFCIKIQNLANKNPSPPGFLVGGTAIFPQSQSENSGYYALSTIDVYNNGKPETVVQVGMNNDDGWGWSYLMAFKIGADVSKFIGFLKTAYDYGSYQQSELNNWTTIGSAQTAEFGGSLINFSSPWSWSANVTNTPIEVDGKIYILSADDDEGSTPPVPAGLVSEFLPDRSVKTLCRFP